MLRQISTSTMVFLIQHLFGPFTSIMNVNNVYLSLNPYAPMYLFQAPQDRVMAVLATCTFALQRSITVLDSTGHLLSRQDSVEASEMLILHCKSYSWLSACFYQQHKFLFKLRPKFHFLFHQALQLREQRLNINMFTNFAEESFLGKCKTIYCACHGGSVNQRFYERYLLCLALMLKQHSRIEHYFGFGSFGVAP